MINIINTNNILWSEKYRAKTFPKKKAVVHINSNLFKLRDINDSIGFRTDFMSPGDRNGLPDVFIFLGGCF